MNQITTTQTPTYTAEIERDPRLKSEHTRRQYRAALGAFETWRGERPLTKTLVEEYAADLQRLGRSPNTINQALAVVRWWARRVTDLAYEQAAPEIAERVSQQAQRVTSVRDVKGERTPRGRHIEQDEIKSLLGVCKADPTPKGARDAAFIAVAVGTAARNEELRALEISDITYTPTGADILIRHGKGDKARVTHLHGGSLEALNAWIDVRGVGDGPIFCPILKNGKIRTGLPITYDGTRKILQKRFLQSSLSKTTTWHDFRRTTIGELLGVTDIATAQQIAGHASPITTSRYDRRPQDRRREALQAINVPY